jgi:transaldolase
MGDFLCDLTLSAGLSFLTMSCVKPAIRATEKLHKMGRSLCLDNITRSLLNSGKLECYITDFGVTGFSSDPTIFKHAVKKRRDYDVAILRKLGAGKSVEELFFEFGLEVLRQAADLFRAIHDRAFSIDGGFRSTCLHS